MFTVSELEVDEGLDVARLHLDYDVDDGGDEEGAYDDVGHGEACHEALLPTVGQVMADETECHEAEHPGIAADDLPQQFGVEISCHLVKHREGCLHVAAAEEYPA